MYLLMLQCSCRPSEAAEAMGIDIRVAQKLMGHSDISLTANIYTNLMDEDIVEIAKKHFGGHAGGHTNIPKYPEINPYNSEAKVK